MERAAEEEGAWRFFVPALAAATLAAKLVLAAAFPGFQSGDDLEIVEGAARAALRFPYVPWEIRSRLTPSSSRPRFCASGTCSAFTDLER